MKLLNEVIAKPYKEEDTEEIVNLILRNFTKVKMKDYGEKAMDVLSATHDVNWFKGVVFCLLFLCCRNFMGRGLAAISLIPLNPMNYFLRAERIEIPASITAVEFYRKKGYEYKNGIKELDAEQHY